MKTFRVKMNNVKPKGDLYDPKEPKGIRFFHICSNSIIGAVQTAEQQYPGECESVTVKNLADPALKISEMQEFENYELMSAPGSPNDTIIFKKNGEIITANLRGKNFLENGPKFWFDLSILNLVIDMQNHKEPSSLTLAELGKVSLEIYSIVKEKQIPMIFKGKMGRTKFRI